MNPLFKYEKIIITFWGKHQNIYAYICINIYINRIMYYICFHALVRYIKQRYILENNIESL